MNLSIQIFKKNYMLLGAAYWIFTILATSVTSYNDNNRTSVFYCRSL